MAYEADTDFYIPKGESRLGQYTVAYFNDENGSEKGVCNLYGQRLHQTSIFGCRTDYFSLRDALRLALHEHYEFQDLELICGFPWEIGCGLGGGNFYIVKYLIEEALKEFKCKGYWVEL